MCHEGYYYDSVWKHIEKVFEVVVSYTKVQDAVFSREVF